MIQDPIIIETEPTQDTPPVTWEIVRMRRDQMLLLAESRYNFDSPESIQSMWREYKQVLRDIPITYADLDDLSKIVWPQMPNMDQELILSNR